MARLLVFVIAFAATVIDAGAAGGDQTLRRQKREWIIPPKKLLENVDYTNDEFISKIRSDEETNTTIRYSLEGPGASEHPIGLFTVDEKLGLVKIHGILDREKTPSFTLEGIARLPNGEKAEKNIVLRIVVLDQNDCTPVFNVQPVGDVAELSATGTYVIDITATDDDEPNTPNSTVTYSIGQQIPPEPRMFHIDRKSGRISVQLGTLDREVQDNYRLIIHGTDNGPEPRNTGTGTVSINVLDVNDNVPFLEKKAYEGSVEENIVNVEVVRIPTIDKDQVNTDNWRAVYTIVSGNEAGYFNITTDPITNEGVLVITKEIDYEELKEINLKMVVSNKAKYHSSVVIRETTEYLVKIRVLNVPEGPRFQPAIKVISMSEDHKIIDLKKVITTYKAIDSDTLQAATNVRYYKGQDADNWLNIDEKTAEIRLNKLPDRESKYLVNGTYYAQIICITDDHPAKTATGTIAIQVEDFNDHCPVLTQPAQTLCSGESALYVTAMDRDAFPNAEPFDFKVVPTDMEQKWNIERLNATTAILRAQENVWAGHHTVGLEVRDQQGKFCSDVQQLHVTVCTCEETRHCRSKRTWDSSIRLGSGGVFAMLLGLLLLLLVPLLLLICLCGGAATAAGFRAFPMDQAQHLMTYHTEGVGEDKDVLPLQFAPDTLSMNQSKHESSGGKRWEWQNGVQEGVHTTTGEWRSGHHVVGYFDQTDSMATIKGTGAMTGIALSEGFLGSYYSKKAKSLTEQHSKGETLRVYEYEDHDSYTGSLENIFEDLHEEDSLAFLDDLGPKFKTLAEICCGSAIETQISTSVRAPAPEPVVSSFPSGTRVITADGSMDRAHIEASSSALVSASASASTSALVSASTSTSTSASTSTSQITATNHHGSISTSSSALLTHPAQVSGHTLLLQQTPMYYASTPVYVVEQQAHPTLLLAARPGLNMQENVVLIDQRAAGVTLPQPHTTAMLELKNMQAKAMEQGWSAVETSTSLGLPVLGSTSGSGSFRVVEREQVRVDEPVELWQNSSHTSASVETSVHTLPHTNTHTGVHGGLTRPFGTHAHHQTPS